MRRDIFQAIADPSRRAILTLLAVQAMTPNALADHFNTSRQSVSKHLRVLTECGVVAPKPLGREVHYTLNVQEMKELDVWLAPFRKMWESRFAQLDKVLVNIKKKRK